MSYIFGKLLGSTFNNLKEICTLTKIQAFFAWLVYNKVCEFYLLQNMMLHILSIILFQFNPMLQFN